MRTAALIGMGLIFLGLVVSSFWGIADVVPDSSWIPYVKAWIGVILLVVVIAIALRAAESARWGSVEDAPWLAMGGVTAVLASLFLFGGVIAALGGIALIVGGIAAGLGRASPASAEDPK